MKSLLHNRIELIEAYMQAERGLDGPALDTLFAKIIAAAAVAARTHFGGGVEVLVHLERQAARRGPPLRVTVTGTALGRWFPRGKNLRASAAYLNQRGRMFMRDITGTFAAALGDGNRGIARKEQRRKAPGKILDLWERIAPVGTLQVARFADLAAKERAWLSEEIASLMRSVHSTEKFAQLMTRLKRETGVAFLPADAAEIGNLRSKLVGVSTEERHLRRRKIRPSFAASDGRKALQAVAARMRLGREGKVAAVTYYGV